MISNNLFEGTEAANSLNNAAALFAEYLGRRLEAIGMRASYRHVMSPLMEKDGVTQLELVNKTGLKAPTISITLRNMERDGVVRREKNESDRRETHVFITDKGRQMYNQALEAYQDAENILLRDMSEEELKAIVTLMSKASQSLSAALDAGEK